MPGKCRPSLRGKTLANVMYSNLSQTDKDCIKAVFERYEERPKGRWTATDIVSKKAGYGVRYYNHAECEVAPCRLFEDMHDFCPACGADMRGESE